jgi:hypothetical protein
VFKLAELFVEIGGNDKPLNNVLAGVHQRLGMAGNALAKGLTAGAAVAGAGLAAGLGYGIKKAVELQDTMSRNSVVFGDSAKLIEAQADQMADKFGVMKGEFLDAAGNFGAMFKGAGASQNDAAVLGNQLTKLAYDMASFAGGSTTAAETLSALGAAMRGEFDPAERFGVFLSADAVAARAVAMGLAQSKTQVSDYAKKQATLAMILEKTKDQQGDLERTGGQTKNQYDKLIGTLSNFATTVGEQLLPTINEWLVALNDRLGPALETAGFVVRNFGDIWEIAQLNISEQIAKILTWIDVIPANLMSFADWLGNNWLGLIRDYFVGYQTIVDNAWKNVLGIFEAGWNALQGGSFDFVATPLLEGFEAATSELPEMIRPAAVEGFEQARQEILDRIGGREMKRSAEKAQAAQDLANAKLEGGGAPAGPGKAGKREIVASDQFAKDLLSGKDTEKQQLDVQRRQLDVLGNMSKIVNKLPFMGPIVGAAAP